MFDQLHPTGSVQTGEAGEKRKGDKPNDQESPKAPLIAGVAFAAGAPKDYCAKISGERNDRLRSVMISLGTQPYSELARALTVPDLEKTVDLVLCPDLEPQTSAPSR
jgi:hypothetical protein